MKDSTNRQSFPDSAGPQDTGFSPWQRLKTKRISYLTLPLIVMATVVEFVILATGWKYQQVVCLPQGMGVIFFGIGPIGATILAVELLKLPLAIWTASRHGWQKGVMLMVGLPLICLLTFQLVKDMAVYEMGVAMTPASQMLEQAANEEIKIVQLNAELANQLKDDGAVKAAIEEKKADRDRKLAESAAKQAKAKSELEESLKRNEASRQDAITLTDYQKKELSEAEARQATIIQQFATDTEQLTKAITDLRARRETEFIRANKDSVGWEARKAAYDAAFAKWHAEDARIDNVHQTAMAAYANKKAAYEKDKAEYAAANFLKRQIMFEPVDPGVPPVRETNKVPKPTELDGRPSALVAEIDAQIKAKEAELLIVNNKRRDRIAQVDADARRLREEFDRRSGTKREETDRKREELLAAIALLVKEGAAEAKSIDQEFATVAQKQEDALKNQRPLEAIRAELDASRKKADGFYEAREAAIKKTQVHRIATTVEIVRGWLFGERPVSITASAKQRGDLLTDQISMVRIWVYPVLAFIVAFLPTLMVEIGFSTIFQPERQRPAHRLGLFGRRLHWLYTRAGRQKILRAERMAREASAEIAVRDEALAAANANAETALVAKEAELRAAHEAAAVAGARHEEQSQKKEAEHKEELKKNEAQWVAKLAGMADTLNRTVVEKDALRDLQKSEIERQIQLRQNAWSDRLTQLRQELDDQRAASEAERTALLQEHHKKLLEVSEDCKTQVAQARRQIGDAELASVETNARMAHDLKEALHARDTAESQLRHQADTLSLKLAQAREDAAREMEKTTRQEKHRFDRQQVEFEKSLRQRDEDFEHRLQQREQELSIAFDARLMEEKTKAEEDARRREAELERQLEARAREVDARWNQEMQQREDASQTRLKQREQQLQAQTEARSSEVQSQFEQEMRRRESEFERQLDAQSREADARLREAVQQKELAFHTKLKQREQELITKASARETEMQNQWSSDSRAREEEWERQVESRVRAAETRLGHEAQQKEEIFQIKLRQREQQLQAQFDARQAELKAQRDQELHEREQEWTRNAEAGARATESRWVTEMQQKEELFQSQARQRDQQWQAKLDAARAELQAQTEQELRRRDVESAEAKQREQGLVAQLAAQAKAYQTSETEWATELEIMRSKIEPLHALLARVEKERDEARQSACDTVRQVQDLERNLMEASSLLTGWRNGKSSIGPRSVRDPFHVARGGLGAPAQDDPSGPWPERDRADEEARSRHRAASSADELIS